MYIFKKQNSQKISQLNRCNRIQNSSFHESKGTHPISENFLGKVLKGSMVTALRK